MAWYLVNPRGNFTFMVYAAERALTNRFQYHNIFFRSEIHLPILLYLGPNSFIVYIKSKIKRMHCRTVI
jgi:hypothetical protein